MAQHHHYGDASLTKLGTCHIELQRVFRRAIKLTPSAIDITIVHGYRDKDQQNGIDPRFTNARWPASYHNARNDNFAPCSEAVDFAPWIILKNGKPGIPWSDTKLFSLLAGIILAAGALENVELTWGGDFDRDGSTEDQTLADLGHVQRTNAARRPRTMAA